MSSTTSDGIERRDLLKAAGSVLLLRPETVFGSQANSTVELGLVGCGGRGNWIAPLFIEHSGARFIAVADVIKSRLESTRSKLQVEPARAYYGPNAAHELAESRLDAVVINTSGCGTTVKDYAHMLRDDPVVDDAARVVALAKDVTEIMSELGLNDPFHAEPLRVAYHAACSLQHGQQIRSVPKDLLRAAGFEVVEPRDSHICCGSAGTYNLMQPAISSELKARKLATIEATHPEVISAGNIGCMMQIGSGTEIPLVHTVELLDWATGGPKPRSIATSALRKCGKTQVFWY